MKPPTTGDTVEATDALPCSGCTGKVFFITGNSFGIIHTIPVCQPFEKLDSPDDFADFASSVRRSLGGSA